MDKKRILFIVAFVIATIVIGFAMYRVFFYTPKPAERPGTIATEPSKFPSSGEAGEIDRPTIPPSEVLPPSVTAPSQPGVGDGIGVGEDVQKIVQSVINTPVVGMDISNQSGQARFYNQEDGKFYSVDALGQPRELTDQVFFNVENVTWSPTQSESIIEYPDGANIYYNFNTKKQVTLPKHWDSFSFTDTGDKIAAKSLGFSEENRWLISSDPTGSNINLIEPLGSNADKVIVDWSPNKQIVGLSATGEELGSDRQEILFVGQNGENFKSTIVEGRDLRTEWSKTGSKLLYSVHNSRNDFKPELWVVKGSGENLGGGRKLLNVDTWADKCSFSDDRYAYCGVPQILEKGSGFAPALADSTPDDLYKIDVETGLKVQIPLDDFHVIDTISLSPDGKTLYFTDKNIPGLYKVQL